MADPIQERGTASRAVLAVEVHHHQHDSGQNVEDDTRTAAEAASGDEAAGGSPARRARFTASRPTRTPRPRGWYYRRRRDPMERRAHRRGQQHGDDALIMPLIAARCGTC